MSDTARVELAFRKNSDLAFRVLDLGSTASFLILFTSWGTHLASGRFVQRAQ